MIKEIQISIAQSYEDVTLRDYLRLQKEIKNYEDNEEAQTAILVTYLCDISLDILTKLGSDDFKTISMELAKWINNTDYPLQQIIRIDGKEYGFEPNLSTMSYGAYSDITKYENIQIDDNWAKIMSILYRPITKKVRDTYEIEPYNGNINEDIWLKVPMSIHFGTMFFFVHLLADLQKGILKYLKGTELPHSIVSILEKSGKITLPSWNLPTTIYQK